MSATPSQGLQGPPSPQGVPPQQSAPAHGTGIAYVDVNENGWEAHWADGQSILLGPNPVVFEVALRWAMDCPAPEVRIRRSGRFG